MLEETLKYSHNQGIGCLIIYQSPDPLQNQVSLIRKANLEDLLTVRTRLDEINKQINNNTFDLQLINRFDKTEEQLMKACHQCYTFVTEQIENRQKNISRRPQNSQRQQHQKPNIIFNAFRLVVAIVLVILFAVSLFSDNDWQQSVPQVQQNSVIHRQKQPQSKKIDSESATSRNAQTYKQTKPKQSSTQQPTLNRKENHQKPYSTEQQQPIPQTPNADQTQTSQKIVFSTIEEIHAPLESIYNFLAIIIPADIAYILCAYVFWPIAWIIAILLVFV